MKDALDMLTKIHQELYGDAVISLSDGGGLSIRVYWSDGFKVERIFYRGEINDIWGTELLVDGFIRWAKGVRKDATAGESR